MQLPLTMARLEVNMQSLFCAESPIWLTPQAAWSHSNCRRSSGPAPPLFLHLVPRSKLEESVNLTLHRNHVHLQSNEGAQHSVSPWTQDNLLLCCPHDQSRSCCTDRQAMATMTTIALIPAAAQALEYRAPRPNLKSLRLVARTVSHE